MGGSGQEKYFHTEFVGSDQYGDFAKGVRVGANGEDLIADAHLNRETPMACVSVRGGETRYSFDFVEPITHEIDPNIVSALDLAKLAVDTVIMHEVLSQNGKTSKITSGRS